MAPRSWLPTSGNIQVVANDPSLSLDLIGDADIERWSVVSASDRVAETKRWNETTEVIDISMENAHPSPLPSSPSPPPRPSLPDPIEPYVPTQVSRPLPTLRIYTDVVAEPLSPGERTNTTERPSQSPIRPLPTPPTRPSIRRPHSAKAGEAQRETRSRLSRFAASADDLRAYRGDSRRSRAHSITCVSGEVDGCEIVQHHDGGVNARIDLPPPYHECLQVQASTSTPHSASSSHTVAWP
jgi:hypothetical protein